MTSSDKWSPGEPLQDARDHPYADRVSRCCDSSEIIQLIWLLIVSGGMGFHMYVILTCEFIVGKDDPIDPNSMCWKYYYRIPNESTRMQDGYKWWMWLIFGINCLLYLSSSYGCTIHLLRSGHSAKPVSKQFEKCAKLAPNISFQGKCWHTETTHHSNSDGSTSTTTRDVVTATPCHVFHYEWSANYRSRLLTSLRYFPSVPSSDCGHPGGSSSQTITPKNDTTTSGQPSTRKTAIATPTGPRTLTVTSVASPRRKSLSQTFLGPCWAVLFTLLFLIFPYSVYVYIVTGAVDIQLVYAISAQLTKIDDMDIADDDDPRTRAQKRLLKILLLEYCLACGFADQEKAQRVADEAEPVPEANGDEHSESDDNEESKEKKKTRKPRTRDEEELGKPLLDGEADTKKKHKDRKRTEEVAAPRPATMANTKASQQKPLQYNDLFRDDDL